MPTDMEHAHVRALLSVAIRMLDRPDPSRKNEARWLLRELHTYLYERMVLCPHCDSAVDGEKHQYGCPACDEVRSEA